MAHDDVLALRVGCRHKAIAEGLAGDDVGLEVVEVQKRGLGGPKEVRGRLGKDAGSWGVELEPLIRGYVMGAVTEAAAALVGEMMGESNLPFSGRNRA